VRAAALLPLLSLPAACVTVVVGRAPQNPPRPQMVRLHGSARDCDEEALSSEDRALCAWLHGRGR